MKKLILFFAIMLAGCQTMTDVAVVPQRTIEVIPVNASLAEPTVAPTPPKPEYYMSLNRDEKEDACMRYVSEYQMALRSCNMDKGSILEIQKRQQKLIEQYNQEEKRRATAGAVHQ